MSHRFGIIRRFRFNRPQKIAAGLLAIFLVQGLWLIARMPLGRKDYFNADLGRETWVGTSPLSYIDKSFGGINYGYLPARLVGLPFTLAVAAERALDHFRTPEDRLFQQGAETSAYDLRNRLPLRFLLRLPFLGAGCMLGGCLWWVTRRLYGNLGGYTALALYCFSPVPLFYTAMPGPEILAALGVYGGIYTAIGVAHAMQGPRRKWRPRIVLLSVILAVVAASHLAAFFVAVLAGLAFMLWLAERNRRLAAPILLISALGALVLVFADYGFSPRAFSGLFHPNYIFFWFSLAPARSYFAALPMAGITLAFAAALILYAASRRSRYFGNTAPLLCALVCMVLVTSAPGVLQICAIPFLFTFIGGVFADAYESARPRLAFAAAGALVALQVALSLLNLAGLV